MAVRVTQTAGEAVVVGSPKVRMTQVAGESLVSKDLANVFTRVTQVAAEALITIRPAGGSRAVIIG